MKLAKLCFFLFFSEALRWGLAQTAWPGMWICSLLLLSYHPGQCSYFSAPSPNPSAPLKVLLRHRREPKSSVGENKVSTSLHPASDTWRYIQEEMNARHQCCCPHPEPHALTETSIMGCCLPPWQR